MSGRRILGVIPARGGSKGIPKKNIRPLAGRPLIYYTIEQAKRSRYLSRLVVSTDNEEIAQVSHQYGAEVCIRPVELATDAATTEWALIHVVETLKQRDGFEADAVVTLEPTSPLRSSALIDRCIEVLVDSDADSVIAVASTSSLVGTIHGGRFEYTFKDQPRRRQDRTPLYKESSAVYVTRTDTLLTRKSVLGERLYAVIAEEYETIDINTPLDFVIAEAVMRWKLEGGSTNDRTN